MIRREEYVFDIGTYSDDLREDAGHLVTLLRRILPEADVNLESAKTDLSILTISFERETP